MEYENMCMLYAFRIKGKVTDLYSYGWSEYSFLSINVNIFCILLHLVLYPHEFIFSI